MACHARNSRGGFSEGHGLPCPISDSCGIRNQPTIFILKKIPLYAEPEFYTFKNHFFFHINQTTRNITAINETAYINDALIGLAMERKMFRKMYC